MLAQPLPVPAYLAFGRGARRLALRAALALGVFACAGTDSEIDESEAAVIAGPLTVVGAVAGSCSTDSVRGLSQQLVDEINCRQPNAIASLAGIRGITFEKEVFPYVQAPLVEPLTNAAAGARSPMRITSSLRTLPQQYLLHQWAARSRCGIAVAARPGSSNHEAGLAIDVDNHAAMLGLLTKAGSCPGPKAPKRACFVWFGEPDPVHFDFRGDGAIDLAGESVGAFQRLWNRNHPEDALAVTSKLDTATEARLKKTPASGFPVGSECGRSAPEGASNMN